MYWANLKPMYPQITPITQIRRNRLGYEDCELSFYCLNVSA